MASQDDLDAWGVVSCDGCKRTWDATFRMYWLNSRRCRGRWHDPTHKGNPDCTPVGGELHFKLNPPVSKRKR